MATQSPPQEEQQQIAGGAETGQSRGAARPEIVARPPISQVLRELDWGRLLLFGLGGGAFWTILLAQQDYLTFLAGLLPVLGGIIVGRRIKGHVIWHAALLSILTVVAALVTGLVLAGSGLIQGALFWQTVGVGLITLLPFPAFGVITARRGEERNQLMREERSRRGGRLERPGRVKSIEELRSLSLPQLGSYVADLFRKHDFKVHDYRFARDNYLEFDMSYEDQPWSVHVTVDEKVKQAVVLQFVQRLREEGSPKGVLITSMDFQEAATRWAKDKPVALIDGPTLLSMHD